MSDVSVSLGVTGKDIVTGAFSDVAKSSEAMSRALMEHTKKLAEMFIGFETVKRGAELFMQTLEEAGRLNNLSDQPGIATSKLTILERAFQNSGMEAEAMGGIVNKMQKFLTEAGDSTSEAAYHIAQLGLNFDALQSLSPDEQLKAIGKAIVSIPSDSERAAAAMGIFGKSGGKLMTFFKDFDEKIVEAKSQLGEFSSIMGMNAADFEKLGDTIKNGIGHKLIEFTAGALVNTKEGLQELADKIAQFDAAKFGKEITDGLGKPLLAVAKDLTSGNFKDAWNLAYELVKLAAMKMGNELVRILEGAFAFSGAFASDIFGDSGPILISLGKMVVQAGSLIVTTFKAAFMEAGSAAHAWVNVAIAAMKLDLPAVISGLAELKDIHNAFAPAAERTAKSWSEITKDSFEASKIAYDAAGDYFNIADQQKKIADTTKKHLEDQKNLTEAKEKEAIATEKTAKNTKTTVASLKDGIAAGNSSNHSNGMGPRWTAKPAPIIDPATVGTGLYKNTANLGLDMQEKLAASSMGISDKLAKQFDPSLKAAQAAGDWRGAAYIERKKAERQQEEQEIGLRKAQLEDAGWSSAAAREQIEKERSSGGMVLDPMKNRSSSAPLFNQLNKQGGPLPQSGQAAEALNPAASKDPMSEILKLLGKYLPSIDESADDIQTNTENFAVLA